MVPKTVKSSLLTLWEHGERIATDVGKLDVLGAVSVGKRSAC